MTADDAHSLGQERTPEGEPIDTCTIWLDFEDGEEGTVSIDLTAWNAAMRAVTKALAKP